MSEPKDESTASPEAAEPAEETAPAKTDDAGGEPAPKKKKKKRKKVADEAQAGASLERPALDADGNERPRFLLRFPADSELEALIDAFERGDYARVRAEAPRLAERTDSPDVKRAAEELLRRIEPDPLVKFLLGVAAALFVAVVTYVYYAHG